MYIITNENNVIMFLGNTRGKTSDGRRYFYEDSNGSRVAFAIEHNEYVIESVPSEVIPEKYCYTEAEGFYINPNWKEPNPDNTYEGVSDEVFEQILSDYREKLAGEAAGNGYNS